MARVNKAVARKKMERKAKKTKASAIRKKKADAENHEFVEMAEPQRTEDTAIDAELNLMHLLGLSGN